jgi:hypothetical protein
VEASCANRTYDTQRARVNDVSDEETTEAISSVIGNPKLASAVQRSVASGLRCPAVRLVAGGSVWTVFETSLNAAIRDIADHPRGKLFQRLIRYGPHEPDDPVSLTSDGETVLSDPEVASAVQFIFSHMVNRFKGELAELLAIEPCLELVDLWQRQHILPRAVTLYWGSTVQERRRIDRKDQADGPRWGSYTSGADGLIVEHTPIPSDEPPAPLRIRGVVEVKSMPVARNRLVAQINNHVSRLDGGVKLAGREYLREEIRLSGSAVMCVVAVPSTWKLSRDWHREDDGTAIVLPEPSEPPVATRIESMGSRLWRITLAWSKEALEQAAYEMTFGYMAQVGRHVFTNGALPRGWESMTPDEAGCNAIKMMLYYVPLRPIKPWHARLAVKLYNIYSFGYPLGVSSKSMLWPEDFA